MAATALAASMAALTGCAFFESAGEITIGDGQINGLTLDFQLPDYDRFVAAQAEILDGADGIAEGRSVRNASLAHILGIVTLAGHCQRTFTQTGKEKFGAVSDLHVRLTACPSGGSCDHLCGGKRGVLIDVQVEVLALDDETSRDLKAKVQQRVEDTLVGLRLRFDLVQPYRIDDDGKRQSLLHLVNALGAGVSDIGGERTEILGKLHRDQLLRGEPVRALFDPSSPITKNIVTSVENGEKVTFRLDASLHITPSDAYEWPIFSSGVRLQVQPEFVISVLGGLT